MLEKPTRSISYLLIGSAAVSRAAMRSAAMRSAAICSLFILMCGCDQISGTPIVQVIGRVRMNRKPLADAKVAFIPLELRGSSGKITEVAFGSTDDTGRFELRTSEARGVLPGEYRVLFFRPSTDLDVTAKAESPEDGAESIAIVNESSSDKFLMLAAVDEISDSAKQNTKALMANVGDVPLVYNAHSNLQFTVKPGSGILYPKFDLNAHPKN